MNRFMKCVCFVLAIAMVLPVAAFATENVDSRASSFFVKHTTYLNKVSDTKFEAWFEVLATGMMDELGAKTIKIQRSSDGVNWTTMRIYSKEAYSQMICENTFLHTDCVTYTGTPGYYYRAYVCYYAKNSSGIGEYDTYSPTILL